MSDTNCLHHQNRMDQVYYIQEGKTSSGKAKYYAGQKLTGKPVMALPDDYEVHEKPETAQVVVRRIKPSLITESEREQTEDLVRRASGLDYFIVAIEDNALVVYTPGMSPSEADRFFEVLAGPLLGGLSSRRERFREVQLKHSQYTKMLRFELVDPENRFYCAERWCFRGSIDHWIPLSGRGALVDLVEKYAKGVDRESFYELM